METNNQLVIIRKIEKYIEYMLTILIKLPRTEKFSIGTEIKTSMYDMLKNNKDLELDYITAPPRMSLYMKYSTRIYNTYLKYISADDIYVYSIDEIFCDLTSYLNTYKLTAKELVTRMIRDVYETTGITATAGIGTNLFLAKVAMDIDAKHVKNNIIYKSSFLSDELSIKLTPLVINILSYFYKQVFN